MLGGVCATNRPRKPCIYTFYKTEMVWSVWWYVSRGINFKTIRKKTTDRSCIFFYREAEIALSYRALGDKHWRAQLKIH